MDNASVLFVNLAVDSDNKHLVIPSLSLIVCPHPVVTPVDPLSTQLKYTGDVSLLLKQ